VDIAINHDPAAIAMHEMNHPDTKHYCESVWDVNPREAVAGRPVALCWLSPDCKHFSKAKGSVPLQKGIRGLAWVALRWAATVRPRVIMLENVEEFQTWGPLDKDGYPIRQQKGRTFRSFVNALRYQGYEVEWKVLRACDYGAPTIRTRLFLVARCDGKPISWPEPTHGDPKSLPVQAKRLKPWRTAAEIIDWSLRCPSIFERSKPLADKTMWRIARGLRKFIIENDKPFFAPVKFECNDNSQLVAAFLAQYHSETSSNDARGQTMDRPLLTLDTSNRYALVTSHLVKFRGMNIGHPANEPVHTITSGGIHVGEVRAFLISYYGASVGSEVNDPLHTVTTVDRFGLVMVHGTPYQIVDIGMRMLEPHELYAAQGFPKEYIIDRYPDGKPVPKKVQVGRCGNSVSPPVAAALIKENLPELCASHAYKEEYQYELQLM
jgi:DNA (cytosine-5)-methyltransferase 1